MCGIAGCFYRDGRRPTDALLRALAEPLAHRGPDGQGIRAFPGGGLAHRRLAVVDPSAASAQPMTTADGDAWIVFNGEIYGFRALREELRRRGHEFRSRGDTEVVLAAYREWDESFVEHLDGMFALAIWDERRGRLLLARDRTGKKPLFLYEDADRLVFGSEIKAILAHPDVDDAIDETAIPLYLAHGYVPGPRTIHRRVRSLPPATLLVHERDGACRERVFWDFPGADRGAPAEREPLAAIEERIRTLFSAAVERRLVADVPLGAFLSGGIDSTLVVGEMSRLSSRPVKTFSIGFPDSPPHDETTFARLAARHFGTEHVELQMTADAWSLADRIAWHFDQPFGDPSAIPTFVVSRLTREHVTVALTGDGGDELFAGYPRFRKAALMERLPRAPMRALAAIARRLPSGSRHSSRLADLRRTLLRAGQELAPRLQSWSGCFDESALAEALTPDLALAASPERLAESFTGTLARAPRDGDLINRLLYLNARTYLVDDLHVKIDRASMAASLETRSPFLDTALMEYVFRLPGRLKQHGTTSKWILKRAFRDRVPREIVDRKKKGFVVPLGRWFRGPLRGFLHDVLLAPGARFQPYVERRFVERIAREHQSGVRDWGQPIWQLAMLERFLGAQASRRASTRLAG